MHVADTTTDVRWDDRVVKALDRDWETLTPLQVPSGGWYCCTSPLPGKRGDLRASPPRRDSGRVKQLLADAKVVVVPCET